MHLYSVLVAALVVAVLHQFLPFAPWHLVLGGMAGFGWLRFVETH